MSQPALKKQRTLGGEKKEFLNKKAKQYYALFKKNNGAGIQCIGIPPSQDAMLERVVKCNCIAGDNPEIIKRLDSDPNVFDFIYQSECLVCNGTGKGFARVVYCEKTYYAVLPHATLYVCDCLWNERNTGMYI